MTLSDEILKLRKEAGLSQVELAKKCEVSQALVSAWELGKETDLKATVLYKLCDALAVPSDHFRPFLAEEPPAKPKGKRKKTA